MQMTELGGGARNLILKSVGEGGVDHKKINKILVSHVTQPKVYLEPVESKSRFGKDKYALIMDTDDR